ncbi:hypothetical protein [Streptomyces longwoodensis]|uniref:hypothetical protein n=1 Tax=Streptomyces longwoodensis TaxID=68231 RepID=UPI0030E1339C|nr:hypothetical protein OG416_11310 [Streptomyces longwoodensis]
MTTDVHLDDLLADLSAKTKEEIFSTPQVITQDEIDVDTLPIKSRKWIKLPSIVAVMVDLKSSTKLGTGKWAASTASIYEASTGGVVKVFNKFDADFIQIQGDGAFALFWGERRFERALCAGVTVNTFSVDLGDQLESRWPNMPITGFKVGVACSPILVKRIGTPRNPAQQEPVWAGKAVNYAAKCAQSADRHEMIVTGSVWDRVERNDYLSISCSCNAGPSAGIWETVNIDRLPDGDPESAGRKLKVGWCTVHGQEYCDAVLAGRKKRHDVDGVRAELQKNLMRDAIFSKARIERADRDARRRGLG